MRGWCGAVMLRPEMQQFFLNARTFYLLTTLFAMLFAGGGCGGGEGDSVAGLEGGEVSVETGSLSKAEFIRKADVICTVARTGFTKEYKLFVGGKLSEGSKVDQGKVKAELVDTVLIPAFKKDIDEISALGAPKGDEQGVTEFLNALKQRLEQLHEDPGEVSNDMFAKPAKLARASGLTGCATTLS